MLDYATECENDSVISSVLDVCGLLGIHNVFLAWSLFYLQLLV